MSSGGGKASTPKLLDDNLKSKQFYRVLDLISEGPIAGPVDQEHLSSFKLNKTPITDSNGNVNVNGISVAWRPGSETQEPINGFSAIEATTIVNTEVTYDTPLVRTVTDQDVTRVRFNIGVSGLMEQDSKGNQKNTSVTMVIETRTGSSGWVMEKTVTITGKISGEYLEAHVIDAPDTKPFDIRVRRITPDSSSDLLSNGTVWNSYSEITDDNLSYPFSAVAGSVIDRDQYTDTPSRTYHLRGLIVDIPDNYDPIARTYSGLWTGGFKKAWTNNPAWLFRELAKNIRFGLAKRAGYIDVDDGALYILSQYCDQLVDDGYGGKEPRMTLNAYITEQASARDILDKIASMFRGIALWDGLRLSVMLDAPQDPIATITNANVVNGEFKRSSVKRSEKYNAVVVSWTDPDNGWEQVKEYVSDDEMIAKGSYNETTLEAFGCTSRGQAWRAGKWLLETAKRESSRLSFQMARDAIHFTPGDIVEVMDNDYAGTRLGGRIISHSGRVITVDAVDSSVVTDGSTMSIMGRDGKFSRYEIDGVNGNNVTLKNEPEWVRAGTVFAISTASVAIRLFRILSVAETENNSVYSITASLHDPNKQAIVDEGAVFEVPSDTLNGYRVPNVENLRILNTNTETVQVTATWETATTTKKLVFELYIYSADGKLVSQYETDQFRYEFYGLAAGSYTLGVRGRNENGMKGAETQVSLIIGAPKAPNSVQWIPGPLQATLVPVMSVTATSDTSFEFWYAGETPIPLTDDIENKTQFLGRGNQWTIQKLKFDHVYYVYVRTRNAFGVSEFVEASGKPTDDFSDITDAILEDIESSETFKDLIENAVDSNEKIAGMADDIKQANDELAQQAQEIAKNAQDIGKVQTNVTNLSSTVGDVSSSLNELEQTVATADTALGQRIDSINVSMDGMAGGVKNSAIAIIQGNLAQVAARKTLSASVAGNSAQLDRIDEVIVNEREATARSLLSLQTDVNGNKASINSLNQTFSDYQQATATQINGITATINGHTSAITTNAQAIANVNGDLKAMYSIKVGLSSNGQYYAAGMGIGAENTPSGMQSQVIFLADRFAVTHQAGATVTLPFVIQNGQVFIREALIGDGTIDNNKIGNYIQSNNYVAGSVGWRLDKGGTFENYGSTAGEGAMKQTNQTISVRDSRNVLRVQIGRITGTW
ncbi:TPA: phage tail protein [Enterobacter hormaechei]|uniref:host specificity protein J n=5 Tax=Enterobacter hormaechei TaxID=158836 RepID=UPI00079718B8|nr:phage tail protein [Enterobacter hormaechei]HCM9116227.1 phage tail protein [Enterobacter hormaechei subsp. steigerwaltii]MBD8854018.1 phage tail protein [Enterobacter hormaechei]CZW86459.1 Phage-related protein%2C tail component [Enterobacter hormaechei]SAH69622.1 Phage-related protein%2C tail component [Enterobacter hormaechei]HAS0772664.1 phage tail protein [Enterobacter hormaechei]